MKFVARLKNIIFWCYIMKCVNIYKIYLHNPVNQCFPKNQSIKLHAWTQNPLNVQNRWADYNVTEQGSLMGLRIPHRDKHLRNYEFFNFVWHYSGFIISWKSYLKHFFPSQPPICVKPYSVLFCFLLTSSKVTSTLGEM